MRRQLGSKGTIYLILKAYRDGIISRDACSEAFEEMVQEGFRVGPEVACIFYRKLEEIASKPKGESWADGGSPRASDSIAPATREP